MAKDQIVSLINPANFLISLLIAAGISIASAAHYEQSNEDQTRGYTPASRYRPGAPVYSNLSGLLQAFRKTRQTARARRLVN